MKFKSPLHQSIKLVLLALLFIMGIRVSAQTNKPQPIAKPILNTNVGNKPFSNNNGSVSKSLPSKSAHYAAKGGGTRVLVITAEDEEGNWSYSQFPLIKQDIETKLMATGLFSVVDFMDVTNKNAVAGKFSSYNVILVFSNYSLFDYVTLGNQLAVYADAGGAIVTASFTNWDAQNSHYYSLGGNFATNYQIFTPSSYLYQNTKQTLGTVDSPNHPIMKGIADIDGGISSYHIGGLGLSTGSYNIAYWSDGTPLVAVNDDMGPMHVKRVDLNFYPVSSDFSSNFYNANSQVTQLLVKSLLYASNNSNINQFPEIISFTPTIAGSAQTVTMKGKHFTGATAVSFGGVDATSFSVIDDSTITAIVGNGASGIIKVTTPLSSVAINGFNYINPLSINSFTPNTGGNGNHININGVGFLTVSSVSLGGTPATAFKIMNDNNIDVTIGAGSSGDVTIVRPDTTLSLSGFVYTQNCIPVYDNGYWNSSCVSGDYINSFSTSGGLTNISNLNSGCTNTAGYTYYSGITHKTTAGSVVNFTIENGRSTDAYKIWVDFDNNGVFDSAEMVYSSGNQFTDLIQPYAFVRGGFKVPVSTVPGMKRLRIRNAYSYGLNWDACNFESYGEAEDYDFEVLPASNITIKSFSPTYGTMGTIDTIRGSHFTGATEVDLGGKPATSFTVIDDSTITATVDSGAWGSIVTVIVGNDIANLLGFTYYNKATITSFTPNTTISGGVVSIYGTGFTGATAVRFGNVNAQSYTVNNDNTINAILDSTGATGDVTVITPFDSASLVGFIFKPMQVNWFTRTYGSTGSTIHIYGVGFSGATSVSFGGVPAKSFKIINDQEIDAKVGNGNSGSVSVSIPSFIDSLSGFTYNKYCGSNLYTHSDCDSNDYISYFGTTGSFTSISYTSSGCSGLPNYHLMPLVNPYGSSHSATTGSVVPIILGTNGNANEWYKVWVDYNEDGIFDSTEVVYASSSPLATNTYIYDNFQIPFGTKPGIKQLRVRMVKNEPNMTACDKYEYGETLDFQLIVTGAITSFSPTAASTGTTVTISGAYIGNITGVSFGGVPATSFSITNDSTVTAVVANGSTGDVSLLSPTGTISLSGFKYIAPLTILSFYPTSGFTGLPITVYGTGFTNATAVSFGAVQASSISVIDDNTLTAIVGAGASGDVKVNTANDSVSLSGFMYSRYCNDNLYDNPNCPSSAQDFINSFSTTGGITNISNLNSGCSWLPCYSQHAATVHSAIAGSKVNFTIEHSPYSYGDWYKVWVDFNDDGVFDATEEVFATTSAVAPGAVMNGSFVIPTGITLGTKQIRVRCTYNTAGMTACDKYGYGEVEDYSLVVVAPSTTVVINSFTPTTATNGDSVTIHGTNFTGTTQVSFGGTTATSFNVIDDNTITATVGTGSTGEVGILTPTDMTSLSGFTYYVPSKNITFSVDITNYLNSGNTVDAGGICIAGNFAALGSLLPDWDPTSPLCKMTQVGSSNIWTITAAIPESSLGKTLLYKFVNTNWGKNEGLLPSSGLLSICGINDGNGNYNRNLTIPSVDTSISYCWDQCASCNLLPSITSFIPTRAPKDSIITIYGTNFIGTTSVSFGGVSATSFNVLDSNTITATVGTGATGNINITNNVGTGSISGFVYVPTIYSFTNTASQGNTITIQGTGFTGVTSVSFGGVPATSFTIYDDNYIYAVVGAGNSGLVTVKTNTDSASLPGFVYSNYCIPVYGYGYFGYYINSFSTSGGLTNISNLNSSYTSYPYYTYNKASVHTATAGSSVYYTFQNGSYPAAYKIFIDFNEDGIFDTTTELVMYKGNNYNNVVQAYETVNGSFSIPIGTTPGTKRMRIRNISDYYWENWDACSYQQYSGEVEDYDLVIQPSNITINSFNPSFVTTVGTIDTIHGANFTGVTAVSFGGNPASSFTVVDDSTIYATVANGNSGNVVVYSSNDMATKSGFEFVNISSFSPTSAYQGQYVAIYGSGLTNVTSVSFGGVPAKSFTIYNENYIGAIVDSGSTGDVTVSANQVPLMLPGFTFIPLSVSSFSPNNVSTGGVVHIYGTGFNNAVSVSFGNVATSSFTVINDGQIDAVVGAGASGYIKVSSATYSDSTGIFKYNAYCALDLYSNTTCSSRDFITGFSTSGGISNINDIMNNWSPCPDSNYIYNIYSNHTALVGSTVNFNIQNNPNFAEYYKVWVDFNENGIFDANELVYDSQGDILAGGTVNGSFVIPNGTTIGTKRIRVRCAFNTTNLTACDKYDYGEVKDYNLVVIKASIAITSFSPTNASANQTVVITGSGFTGASSVSFGGVQALNYIVNDDNHITATVASGSSGNVSVTSPFGTTELSGFIYNNITYKNVQLIGCDIVIYHGITYTTSTQFVDTIKSILGTDSIYTTVNIIIPISNYTDTVIICSSMLPYVWGDTTLNAGGIFVRHYTSIYGCDSTATLNLIVNAESTSSTDTTICNSALPFYWNFNSYSSAGNYVIHFINAVGCDSAATLNLTVIQPATSTTNITACNSYNWNGNKYDSSGTYNFYTLSVSGCDSIATLNLTINMPSTSTTNVIKCSHYDWNGHYYNNSGRYTYTTTNAVGCDSTAILNLIILPEPVYGNVSVRGGNKVIFKGITYLSDTLVYDTLRNLLGCDSVYNTVNILIIKTSIVVSKNPLCGNEIATFTSKVYNGTSVVYQWFKNGQIIIGATSASYATSSNNVGDDYQLRVVSKYGITNPIRDTILSNIIHLNAVTITPYVSIVASTNNICPGTSVTFTATPTNGGSNPSYQWKVNGVGVGLNSPIFTSTNLVNNDKVTCVMTANNTCQTAATATSNGISLIISPIIMQPIIGPALVCQGSTVQLSNSTVGNGTWAVTNQRGSITSDGKLTGITSGGNAIVSYAVSNGTSAGCNGIVYYNVNVASLPAKPSVKNAPKDGPYCIGSSFTLAGIPSGGTWNSNTSTATITNTGTLKVISSGSISITYTTVPDVNGCTNNSVFVRSTGACTIAPRIDNSIVVKEQPSKMSIYPNPVHGIVTIDNGKTVLNKKSNLLITDITGKVLKSKLITEIQTKVNTEGLIPGIYLVTIQTSEGKTTEKLVVE